MHLPPVSRPLTCTAAALAICLASSTRSPAVFFDTTVLVEKGDRLPGSTARYDQIFDYGPPLNNSGRVAFGARLNNSSNDAVMVATGFSPDAILFRQGPPPHGTPSPDGNGEFESFAQFSLNRAGQAAYVATLSGTSGDYTSKGAFVTENSDIDVIQVIRGGDPVPVGLGTISAFAAATVPDGVAINTYGEIAGTVQLVDTGSSDDDVAIYRGAGAALTEIVRKGQVPPGGTEAIINLEAPSINDSGQVAFLAELEGGDNFAFFRSTGDGLAKMVRPDDSLPGGVVASFNSFAAPINASGHIALSLKFSGDARTEALLLATGPADPGDPIGLVIARQGDPAPGGGEFSSFDIADNATVSLNDSDAIAFRAQVFDGSKTVMGLYLFDGSTLRRIAIKGETAPDGNGTFDVFGAPAINANGDVVFQATLNQVATGADLFFYEASTDRLHEVVRRNDRLAGDVLVSVTFLSIPRLGLAGNGFNDSGQVAFYFLLTNGDTGIAMATPRNLPDPVITITETESTASDFTVDWTISNNAGVDVYRSDDLLTWGSPIEVNNVFGTFTESPLPPGQAFYILVPSGQTFP